MKATKIKTRDAVRLYNILAPLKLDGLSQTSKFSIYALLNSLRPVAENCDKSQAMISDKEKTSLHEEAYDKVSLHALSRDGDKNHLSPTELDAYRARVQEHRNLVNAALIALFDKEVDVVNEFIPQDDIVKITDVNSLVADSAAFLMQHLSKTPS